MQIKEAMHQMPAVLEACAGGRAPEGAPPKPMEERARRRAAGAEERGGGGSGGQAQAEVWAQEQELRLPRSHVLHAHRTVGGPHLVRHGTQVLLLHSHDLQVSGVTLIDRMPTAPTHTFKAFVGLHLIEFYGSYLCVIFLENINSTHRINNHLCDNLLLKLDHVKTMLCRHKGEQVFLGKL